MILFKVDKPFAIADEDLTCQHWNESHTPVPYSEYCWWSYSKRINPLQLWMKSKSVSTEINGTVLSVILNAVGDTIQSGLTLCICEWNLKVSALQWMQETCVLLWVLLMILKHDMHRSMFLIGLINFNMLSKVRKYQIMSIYSQITIHAKNGSW